MPAPSTLLYYQNMPGIDYLKLQKQQQVENSQKLLLKESPSEKFKLPNRLTDGGEPNSYNSSTNKKQATGLSGIMNRLSSSLAFGKKPKRQVSETEDGEAHKFIMPNRESSAIKVQSVTTSIQDEGGSLSQKSLNLNLKD